MAGQIARELADSGHQAFEEYQALLQQHHWNLGDSDVLAP
jgi:hypothetical protein